MIKPIRVLCKRTLTCGTGFYFDEETNEKIYYDNRMFVKGHWYFIVYNPNDEWSEKKKTFSVIDNQGNRHLHFMYSENDKKNWPSICKDYGPRDYAKWFYTPEELKINRLRRLKTNAN